MTKEEAITCMKNGEKITHEYFSSDEWMTMGNGELILEDGVKCSPDYFWQSRTAEDWNDGYSIYGLK